MPTTISKIDVATELLDRALDVFLDQRAFVQAIVLAGAAEDVFQGYLLRNGKEPARTNFATGASKLSSSWTPPAVRFLTKCL